MKITESGSFWTIALMLPSIFLLKIGVPALGVIVLLIAFAFVMLNGRIIVAFPQPEQLYELKAA